MQQPPFNGVTGNQSPTAGASGAGYGRTSSSVATRPPKPLPSLLNAIQAAAIFGVSERTFHSLRRQPWMPAAIVLGPRIVRWNRSELEAASVSAPRQQGTVSAPPQLIAGKRAKAARAAATV